MRPRLVAGPLLATLFSLAAGCGGDRADAPDHNARPAGVATGWGYDDISDEDVERGRRDPAWRAVVQVAQDTTGEAAAWPETREGITREAVNGGPMHLPVRGDADGPSVLRVQVLLDRALFAPGIIDGGWGKNSEKAVYWFQTREGLPATGTVDRRTFERLVEIAGNPQEIIVAHTLTADDVEGPFVKIPSDIYEHARLDCSCYESLREKLGERFHIDPAVLEQLNPGVELNGLSAGDLLHVPLLRDENAAINARIARIVVSANGHFVHAVDDQNRVVLHFPSTLGSSYDPSPDGQFEVTSITHDPWWHYQPAILEHVDSSEEDARIPPGPNSAVGVVWMALSKPHYGIHGTSRPQTIGYATSAGCVRLTNWDARFLARRIESGVAVVFRDT
jgi:lipoprotein-anchoring transpeptidase ErfK/SrfK